MTHDLTIAQVKPGTLNPRKFFDEQALGELTNSVATDGVLSNLIVRPTWCIGTVTAADLEKAAIPTKDAVTASSFEIVSGERRYRAAKAAMERDPKLRILLPVRVKAMTDPEVLAINLTEQMQRDQLRPLEEADGFAQLLSYKDGDGQPLHTVDSLAARVGKAHDYVLSRLKLIPLPAFLKEALNAGDISPRVAELVARVPDEASRVEAGQLVLTGGREGRPMTVEEAGLLIEEKFMVELKGSPFNQEDAELVPAAGKCSACPYRTGNIPALAKRRARTDICTNPACYRGKCQAAFLHLVAEANRNGVTVLTDKDSARHFEAHRTTEVRIDSEWVELDTRPMEHLLKAEVKNPPTWIELLTAAKEAGMAPEVVLAKDGAGRGRWLVNSTLLIVASEKLGEPIFKGQKGSDGPSVAPRPGEDAGDTFARGKREHEEQQRQHFAAKAEENRLRELMVSAQIRAVHAGLIKAWIKAPIWDELIRCFHLVDIPVQWMLHLLLATKETNPEKLIKLIRKQQQVQRQALVPMLLAARSMHDVAFGRLTHTPSLTSFAQLAGVDLAAVAKVAQASVVDKKPKPPKKAPRKSPAAKPVSAVKSSVKKRGAK